jgi:hypothetical protein
MNLIKTLIITIVLLSPRAYSFYTEVGASWAFQREVYGTDYTSKLNENQIMASAAFYFFSLTGLELSYSWKKWDNLDKTIVPVNNDRFVTGQRRTLYVQNFGIGISQYFNSTKAILRPGLGVGYVRRLTEDGGYVDVYDDLSGTSSREDREKVNTSSDLLYLLISLKFRIIEGLYLSGSVRTLFAPKQYKEAPNNLRFFIGFSWLF